MRLRLNRQVCEIVFPMIDKVTVEEQGDGEGSEDQDGDQEIQIQKLVVPVVRVLMNKILILR